MDFSWSQQQKQQFESVLTYCQDQLNADVAAREQQGCFSAQGWQRCGEAGLLGLSVPQQYGGQGHDALTTAYLTEALGQGCEDAGLVFACCSHLYAGVMPIVEYGSELQKQRFLPALACGQNMAANGMTEPDAGSDVFNLQTTAQRDGDEYILNGYKSYVTNAPLADTFLIYARQYPQYGYLGLTCFIVDRQAPGLAVGQPFSKMGLNTTQASDVTLTHCRVAAAQRLGAEGQGAAIFSRSMLWERSCLFAGVLGAAQRLLTLTIEHAKQRKQFNQAIGCNQAVSHRLVDLSLALESARLLLYRACWLMDQQQDATAAVSMAKLAISEAFVNISLQAIQVYGGRGYNRDEQIEGYLRHAMGTRIFSGTSEIQRELIAHRLGL